MLESQTLTTDQASGILPYIEFLFPPIVLLIPLVVAAAMPTRTTDPASRRAVRGKLFGIVGGTALALAIWCGAAIGMGRFAWMGWVAEHAWFLEFPLVAAFLMPILRLKGYAWAGATGLGAGGIRTATLGNRARQNPVTKPMWALPILACAVGPIFVGLRAVAAPGEPGSWLPVIAVAALGLVEVALLPTIIRAMLMASEPSDATGSRELAEVYAVERGRRVLGLFWLAGVVAPAALGILFALVVCFPEAGVSWGIVGITSAALLAVLIAIYGSVTMTGYARAAKLRARLEQAASSRAAATAHGAKHGS